jgi:large subunit ribosomal protein L4
MKAAALRGALSDRARGGRVHVVAGLVDGDAPSTKTASAALARIVDSRHVLLVAEREDVVTWKSLRNLPAVHVIAPDQLNTYDVLISDDVVFTEGALAMFLGGSPRLGEAVETLAQEPAGRPAPVRKDSAAKKSPAKKAAATKATAATSAGTTAATSAGTTTPAGDGVSDEQMAAEVAEQTSPDLKAEEAFEKAADKLTDEPAETALADEVDTGTDELGGEA